VKNEETGQMEVISEEKREISLMIEYEILEVSDKRLRLKKSKVFHYKDKHLNVL
jgi:hypothetical protein